MSPRAQTVPLTAGRRLLRMPSAAATSTCGQVAHAPQFRCVRDSRPAQSTEVTIVRKASRRPSFVESNGRIFSHPSRVRRRHTREKSDAVQTCCLAGRDSRGCCRKNRRRHCADGGRAIRGFVTQDRQKVSSEGLALHGHVSSSSVYKKHARRTHPLWIRFVRDLRSVKVRSAVIRVGADWFFAGRPRRVRRRDSCRVRKRRLSPASTPAMRARASIRPRSNRHSAPSSRTRK